MPYFTLELTPYQQELVERLVQALERMDTREKAQEHIFCDTQPETPYDNQFKPEEEM